MSLVKEMSAKSLNFFVQPPQNDGLDFFFFFFFCEIERKPSFNGQYFQIRQVSDIWSNEKS